ncbi:MAG: leucine-rich repeat domain-containing protein [Desulfosporosinus sp.]
MRTIKINKVNTFLVGILMMAILLCCSSQVQAGMSSEFEYNVTADQAQITGYNWAGGDVTIPSTLGGYPVTSIGDGAFYNCTGITSISLSQEVTSIGDWAFFSCKRLTSVCLSQGVTSIGSGAFSDCTGLTTIRFNSATTTIYDSADTIPATTKIVGYDTSTAKDYAHLSVFILSYVSRFLEALKFSLF